MDSAVTITQSIVVKAEKARVWKAITQPEHFSKWFGMEIRFKPVVGEIMTFIMDGGQEESADITIVEPMDRFAFNWTAEPGHLECTLVTFQLETVDEGTRITVTESGYENLPEEFRFSRFASNQEGWRIQMGNIAAYLEANHV